VESTTVPGELVTSNPLEADVVAARARAIPRSAAGKTINLKRYVTINRLFVLKRTWIWGVIGLVCLVSNLTIIPAFAASFSQPIYGLLTFSTRLGCLLPLAAWWYWGEYRKHIELRVEGFRLVSVTGVFLKKVDSRPLVHICSVTVDQNLLGQLVDLFEVRFYCLIGNMAKPYISFPSLSHVDALVIEEYLNLQMSSLICPAAEALELERAQGRGKNVH
jgi:hypothetical protein